MREIRPSGLEGGVRLIPHPYPYQVPTFRGAKRVKMSGGSLPEGEGQGEGELVSQLHAWGLFPGRQPRAHNAQRQINLLIPGLFGEQPQYPAARQQRRLRRRYHQCQVQRGVMVE